MQYAIRTKEPKPLRQLYNLRKLGYIKRKSVRSVAIFHFPSENISTKRGICREKKTNHQEVMVGCY